VSERVPSKGKRNLLYLIVSSILSFPWIMLVHMSLLKASFVYLVVLLTIQSIGATMVDVIVDVKVAQTTKENRFSPHSKLNLSLQFYSSIFF